MDKKKLIILSLVLVWLATMGYLILKMIDIMVNLARNLFPEQVYLTNIQQIPDYLGQVGITMGYICLAIIFLSIIICGLYLGLKKTFSYWRMIE